MKSKRELGIDNNILRGGRDIRLEPCRRDKPLPDKDHTFNPETMERVPHPSGKGIIERLKTKK